MSSRKIARREAGSQDTLQGRPIDDSSVRDDLDLFKFRSFYAKKSRHVDDLIWTYEVGGLSAEFLYTGRKLTALHCFRDIQAEAAGAFF
jgi:hypothetical protein